MRGFSCYEVSVITCCEGMKKINLLTGTFGISRNPREDENEPACGFAGDTVTTASMMKWS